MNKHGPIIVIEDDADDQEMLQEVFNNLDYNNEIVFFSDGEKALTFLNETENNPFLILSDINMPKLSGYELRKKIRTDAKLEIKCIPYLFFTTAANQKNVIEAYSLSVQGFFTKPTSIVKLEEMIKTIIEYWKNCAAPNQFEV